VIVPPLGAAPELVVDRVTGFVRPEIDDMVDAVGRLGELSAEACRARVAEKFTAEVMVSGYERIFDRVLSGRSS
jgi:glycosyltransferase involved in cell wall biosynthesis